MARRQAGPPEEVEDKILDVDVSSEMQTSFLEYAYSVIYARALPDARDGLKPVQRRILFAMQEMNLRPDRGHVKSSRVVGQVMGLYHPHGDTAIYDALVRLSQDWTMRLPVIDGHGNFGSPDAGPAAMRYTECRLAPAALAMTDEIDQNTVDFRPNYDGREQEPVVLPAAFPNLLVNGTTGIAVGMATNIPPHNLGETVRACRHLLKHPNAQLDTLMKYIPGPDLPTGGRIIGLGGIADAYETGRGSFKIRATTRIEKTSPRRQGIVVTELPWTVGPEKVMEQIKSLVQNKKIQGIADVADLSERGGTRLVIEIKNGFNPEAVAEKLFRRTKLEDSFSINSVALVDGQPRTLGLRDMLQVYLDHRLDVTLRRTIFNRDKALERLHLVEGLLIAILDIDDVIAIIRSSENAAEARGRLIEVFELTETQANYILDMQLRRLTKFSRIELESERDELRQRIADLTEIIEHDDKLRAVVDAELAAVAAEHGTPRRTVLLESSGVTASTAPLEVPDGPCRVVLGATGRIARVDHDGALPERSERDRHDVITDDIPATTRGEIGAITNRGRLVRVSVLDLPSVPATAQAPNLTGGEPIDDVVDLEVGERVICLTTLSVDSLGLALGTRRGVVKRVKPEILGRDDWEVITLADGDEIVGGCELTGEDVELVFITSEAQLLHFPASAVRPQGRSGGGVAGIKLPDTAAVVFFGAAGADASVVTLAGSDALPGADASSVKITAFAEFPGKGRATAGVRCHRFLKGENALASAWVGVAPVAGQASGAPADLPSEEGRRDGSGVPVTDQIDVLGR